MRLRWRGRPERDVATPPPWLGFLDGDSVLVLTHPDAVRHVLHDNHANYIKGGLYDDARLVLGEGLLTNDGSSWLSDRRLVQPAFRPVAVESYLPVVVETIAAFLRELRSRVQPGGVLDVVREMSRLTLRVVTRGLLRVDLAEREDRILDAVTDLFLREPMSRGPFVNRLHRYLPFLVRLRSRRARSELADGVSWILRNRSGSPDLVAYFETDASDAAGARANAHVRDHVATFLLAGHETSALGLTWALYLLSENPDAETAIRAEIAEVLEGARPTSADLPRLRFTEMVIRESMRLYPPIPAIAREAVHDDVIAGFEIPAHTILRIKPTLLHRHPEFWADPDRFWPERFSPERAAAHSQWAYIPFGAGPRTCIGNHFAMMEMKLALAMILRAVRLRPVQAGRVDVVSFFSLRPREPLWMVPEFLADPE